MTLTRTIRRRQQRRRAKKRRRDQASFVTPTWVHRDALNILRARLLFAEYCINADN